MGNDTPILITLISFFVLLGILVPLIQIGFDEDEGTVTNIAGIQSKVDDAQESSLAWWIASSLGMLLSVISMFVWSVAGIPVILNTLLLLPRIILLILIIRWIRGVG